MDANVQIIMSVYNNKETVAEAIESVLQQDYRDFHLWLIDDGSTDGASEILKQYSNENNNISLITQLNSGLGKARNRVIDEIKNLSFEFIAFIDSDDVWHPQKLTKQIDVFMHEPNADIVVTQMIKYHKMSEEDFNRTSADNNYKHLPNMLETLCLYNFPFQPVTSLIKKELFYTVANFTDDISGQDFYPFLMFAYYGKSFFIVERPLYRERELAGSLQRSPKSALRGGKARMLAIRKLIDIAREDDNLEDMHFMQQGHDRYCNWMLSGARKTLPWGTSVKLAYGEGQYYYSRRKWFVEMVKSLCYFKH